MNITMFGEKYKLRYISFVIFTILLYFFSLTSKYSPHNPVLRLPQSMFFLIVRDQVSHPYILYILFLGFLGRRWDDERLRTEW